LPKRIVEIIKHFTHLLLFLEEIENNKQQLKIIRWRKNNESKKLKM